MGAAFVWLGAEDHAIDWMWDFRHNGRLVEAEILDKLVGVGRAQQLIATSPSHPMLFWVAQGNFAMRFVSSEVGGGAWFSRLQQGKSNKLEDEAP